MLSHRQQTLTACREHQEMQAMRSLMLVCVRTDKKVDVFEEGHGPEDVLPLLAQKAIRAAQTKGRRTPLKSKRFSSTRWISCRSARQICTVALTPLMSSCYLNKIPDITCRAPLCNEYRKAWSAPASQRGNQGF